jgi:signal peptidase
MARHAPLKGPRIGALTATLAVAVLVSALGVFGWELSGGRLMTMTTPSMCPTVCVGSLVAIRPQTGPVHPGELVAFHPPGQSATFTHRVVKVEDNGSFTTKGDAEASPDPWVVPPHDVVGQVAFTVFGLGWWLRALPMVAAGTILLLLTRRAYRQRNRRSFERVFGVLILTAPLLVLHPLIRGQMIEAVSDPRRPGWMKGLFVNTGLLPAQLHIVGAGVVPSVGPSRLVWLRGPKVSEGIMGVRQWAALPAWGWAVVAAIVLAPLIGFVLYRAFRRIEPDTGGVPVADAMALAPLHADLHAEFVTAPSSAAVEPAHASSVAAEVDESAEPLVVPVPAPVLEAAPEVSVSAAVGRVVTATATNTATVAVVEPVMVEHAVTSSTRRATSPAGRYSTLDRSHRVTPEPRAMRRALGSGSAPRRNGGHRTLPVLEPSRASHPPSQIQEPWSVRWPD